jgi:5'(3')-deoxyribonucleotidase
MNILQKTWIDLRDLKEEVKNMFLDHYKNGENVVILCGNKNIEYKITNIKDNIMNLEFTGKVII